MLSSKLQEVKLTQKRQREQQLKMQKQLQQQEEDIRKSAYYLEKVRGIQSKLSSIATKDKFVKAEYVQKDELRRVKERVNTAFEVFLKLHEETINRDSVIVESLLDTQLGKLRRLIVKKNTHEDLKMFADDDKCARLKRGPLWRGSKHSMQVVAAP